MRSHRNKFFAAGAIMVALFCGQAPGPSPSAFYLATTGSDSNDGSLGAPFRTPSQCQTAMRNSVSSKICYVRGGTYSIGATLNFSAADNGETWSYYAADGYNSAIFDGGSTGSGIGTGTILSITNTANFTWNGIAIQHFQTYGILGSTLSNFTVSNSNIGFQTTCSSSDCTGATGNPWQSGTIAIFDSVINITLSHNYLHNTTAMGMILNPWVSPNPLTGVVDSNVILNACQQVSDCGALYVSMHGGYQGSDGGLKLTNNIVRDYGTASTGDTAGIYMDDTLNHAWVKGNIVGPPGDVPSSGKAWAFAIENNSGAANKVSGNIIDLGSSARVFTEIWFSMHEPVNMGLLNETFTGNVVLSKFAGGLLTNMSGSFVGFAFAQSSDPLGDSFTIQNNDYWNYGGSVFSNGTVQSDIAPQHVDPQISGYLYTIAPGSPILGTPVNFPPIAGSWGPPGFTVPTSTNCSECLRVATNDNRRRRRRRARRQVAA